MGGKVLRTPTEDGMKGAIEKAVQIRKEIGKAWIANQFSNTDNPLCHYQTTGREIWEQTKGKVTHIALGAGTGGTFSELVSISKREIQTYSAMWWNPKDLFLEEGNTKNIG